MLTPAGLAELRSVLGEECAQRSAESGTRVVAMAADAGTADVVVLAEGPCGETIRLDIEGRLGRLVPLDAVVVPPVAAPVAAS